MKKISVLLLAITCSIALFSQSIDFDLNSYDVPETKYQMLYLDLSGNSYIDNRNSIIDASSWNTNSRNQFQLRPTYYQYRNLEHFQSTLNTYFSYRYNDYYSYNETAENLYRNFDSSFSLKTNNRFYINKMFVYGGLEADYNGYLQKDYKFDELQFKRNRYSYNITPSLGFGYGRIDQVQDARLAVYILEDLYKMNISDIDITDKEIKELASLITELKAERYFDSRIKRMENLKEIDSLMHKMGIVSESLIDCHNIVSDQWAYAINPIREKGSRVTFSFEYNYYQNNGLTEYVLIDDSEISESSSNLLSLNLDYYYTVPLNLKWHAAVGLNNSLYRYKNITDNPETESENGFRTNPRVLIGYYPNSRTSVYSEIGYGLDYVFGGEDVFSGIYSSLNIAYYISPKIRLNANLSYSNYYNYIESLNREDSTSRFSSSFSFKYDIFSSTAYH